MVNIAISRAEKIEKYFITMANITTYFIGQTEVLVYLPMANLQTSGGGCGLFEYKISGYQGELFHIADNTLFIKEYPAVGTYKTMLF